MYISSTRNYFELLGIEIWIQDSDFDVVGNIFELYDLLTEFITWDNDRSKITDSAARPIIWVRDANSDGWWNNLAWYDDNFYRLRIARNKALQARDEDLQPDGCIVEEAAAAYGASFECDLCCDTGASAPDERCICTYPDNEPSFEDVVDCNSFNPSHPEGDEPSPEEVAVWNAHLAAGGFTK